MQNVYLIFKYTENIHNIWTIKTFYGQTFNKILQKCKYAYIPVKSFLSYLNVYWKKYKQQQKIK